MSLFTNIEMLKNYEIVDAIVRKVQTNDQKYIFNLLADDMYSAFALMYERGYKEALAQVKVDIPDYRVGVRNGFSWEHSEQEKTTEAVEPVKAPKKLADAGRGRKAMPVAHDVVS